MPMETVARITAANIGLPKAGQTCIIEQLCFYFTCVLGDRLVLLMPCLQQAVKRYPHFLHPNQKYNCQDDKSTPPNDFGTIAFKF